MQAIFEISGAFRADFWLANQMNESAESVMTNISEGFPQPTDRGFARYLDISAGSAEESRTHLMAAQLLGHVSEDRCRELRAEAAEIEKMIAALAAYLRRSNRKNRFSPVTPVP